MAPTAGSRSRKNSFRYRRRGGFVDIMDKISALDPKQKVSPTVWAAQSTAGSTERFSAEQNDELGVLAARDNNAHEENKSPQEDELFPQFGKA
ncbi:MAG: hypothetical protein ACLPIX_10200 [Rhodomicrobium sp.]